MSLSIVKTSKTASNSNLVENFFKEIDKTKLEDQRGNQKVAPPKLVRGRTVHIDGDFLAYMVSYDDSKSVLDMQHNCDVKIEEIRLMAGAESVNIHLTPKDSTKGNRYNIAIQKEYQGNRKGKVKPRYLHMIRDYMHTQYGAVMAMTYEADDSMCMEAHKARLAGKPELCVIATKDKDLCMIPGWQLNWDTGELNNTEDDFGYIELDRSKSTPKVRGRGYKFFFAQLLMGDTADDIRGLPTAIHKDYTLGKAKKCGPVLTYDILSSIDNIKDCFKLTKELFKSAGEYEPYKHWSTGKVVSWQDVMISEMKLLWMRRVDNENDVLTWLKEVTK